MVGDSFLVSVGDDFVCVWSVSDGKLLVSKEYGPTILCEKLYRLYRNNFRCIPVSSTSFLYIQEDMIRRLVITTPSSTIVQIEEVNRTRFHDDSIWPSEVRGGKVALFFKPKKTLSIFDIMKLTVNSKLDVSQYF